MRLAAGHAPQLRTLAGHSGATIAIMAFFDKTGKPVMSMKGLEGKPVGPASPEEIAKAKKHQAELLMITAKVRR